MFLHFSMALVRSSWRKTGDRQEMGIAALTVEAWGGKFSSHYGKSIKLLLDFSSLPFP